MPYFKIETNTSISDKDSLLKSLSKFISDELGKPEKYIMGEVQGSKSMIFDGSDSPLAFVMLKSIGLPESETSRLSRSICDFISRELSIKPDRIYIEFVDIERSMWGWNGKTF